MNVQQFAKLIFDAVKSMVAEERTQSETLLLNFKEQQPVEFIQMGTQILIDESQPSDLRQASGTLIKRVLTMSGSENNIWDRLNQEQKHQIKELLLQTLVTKDQMAKRATADTIASICSIELPRNEWPNIIQILVNQTNNPDHDIIKSAVMTLGFICENLKDKNDSLDSVLAKQIMTGILMSMRIEQTNEDIKFMGVKALQDSLSFMQAHMQNNEVRDYMMNQLLSCIASSTFKIKVKSIQTMVDFAKIYIQFMKPYISQISNILQQYIEDEDTEVSIISVEFYNQIATEEKEKKQLNLQLTEQFAEQIVPKLLKNLTKPLEDEYENSIQEASENCLCSICEINGDKVLPIFTLFLQNTINSNDSNFKRAAMIAFGSMIEGPSKETMNQIISSGLPSICQVLLSTDDQLSYSASQTLSKIAEQFPDSIINHNELQSVIICLIQSLQRSVKISKNICWCFNLMAEAYPDLYIMNPNHAIFNYVEQMVQAILQNTSRQLLKQDCSLIDVSYLALMNILHNINNGSFQQKYLDVLLEVYQNSNTIQGDHRLSVRSGVQACIHQSITKQTQIDVNKCNQIFELINQDFQQIKDVHADGLYVISALATVMEDKFLPLMVSSYNYIKHGLQKTNDLELFKTCLGTLGDICRSCSQSFHQYLVEVIPALLNCINISNIDKQLKLAVFNCLGDLALSCPNTFTLYINDIMTVYNLGFVAAVQLQDSNNRDNQDYAEQLKENLIESYTCFVHSMQDIPECKDKIFLHLQTVVQFIEKTCDESLNPTIDYIRMCLTLVADLGNFYKDQSTKFVKTNFSQNLINNLNKFSHVKENKETIQFAVQTLSKLK